MNISYHVSLISWYLDGQQSFPAPSTPHFVPWWTSEFSVASAISDAQKKAELGSIGWCGSFWFVKSPYWIAQKLYPISYIRFNVYIIYIYIIPVYIYIYLIRSYPIHRLVEFSLDPIPFRSRSCQELEGFLGGDDGQARGWGNWAKILIIYGIYMGYIWDIYGIYMGYIWDIYGIYMGYIYIYGIYIWDIYIWDIYGIYMGYYGILWDIHIYICTIWLFNIAMERSTILIGKPSINGPFSMAMLNNQRVYIYIPWPIYLIHIPTQLIC